MNDEQMQSLLEVWYRERAVAPRDVRDGVASVMANVPRTRQQGRWWPLPTFERPVSTLPSRELAPAPIPATSGRQPARGFTMFSALKFMVASVIVALFGGFLMMGILTTQQGDEMAPAAVTESPLPMTTEEMLSGIVTEEVEPGVYQVVNDGVRDLSSAPSKSDRFEVVAGHDGSIWKSCSTAASIVSGTTRSTSGRSRVRRLRSLPTGRSGPSRPKARTLPCTPSTERRGRPTTVGHAPWRSPRVGRYGS